MQKNSPFIQYLLFLLTTFAAFVIGEALNPAGSLANQRDSVFVLIFLFGLTLLTFERIRIDIESTKKERVKQSKEAHYRLELLNKTLSQMSENIQNLEIVINQSDDYDLHRSIILKWTKHTKFQKNLKKLERRVAELDDFAVPTSKEHEEYVTRANQVLADIAQLSLELNRFEDELIDLDGDIQVKRLSDLDRAKRLSDAEEDEYEDSGPEMNDDDAESPHIPPEVLN